MRMEKKMTEKVMTVRTERTPNPNSLKYNLGTTLLAGAAANFPTKESSENSPLARRLFVVEGVTGVFIGADFITVTKAEDCEWSEINSGVAPALEDFFESGEKVVEGSAQVEEVKEIGEGTADPELIKKIKDLIEEKVRPAVAQDGGDITYRGFDNGVVYLQMMGSCSGCPSSSITLKQGIESMLTYYVPEVKEVRAL